jgi:hypothetical protein
LWPVSVLNPNELDISKGKGGFDLKRPASAVQFRPSAYPFNNLSSSFHEHLIAFLILHFSQHLAVDFNIQRSLMDLRVWPMT